MTRSPIRPAHEKRRLGSLHRYVGGQIACRSLRPFKASERTILTIPGGPGLGNSYLEPFLMELAKRTGLNVALVDLPNHGESIVAKNDPPLDYRRTVELLRFWLKQVVKDTGGVVLFGQSLGARLAFDLLANHAARVQAAVLTGFPCRFENSTALSARLANVTFEDLTEGPEDEERFARNWRKVLPFYTPQSLPREAAEALASGTKWRGNEHMLDGAPSLDDVAAGNSDSKQAVLVIQGAQDMVVPDGNLAALKGALPKAEFREIPDAGHFVMVEKPEQTAELIRAFLAQAGIRP